MHNIKNWISDGELESIYSSSFWNDIEIEKKKEWWIDDGNYKRCLDYLDSSTLRYEYVESERFIKEFPSESLIVADLAAGIGWTSVLLSKLSNVKEVHAVEISKHRLGLFEHSIKMLKGNSDKIFRYLGSFYELNFDDNSVDLVYMSQAFHHAQKPFSLLDECDRVLKKNGRIILVGEHAIGLKSIIRRFMSNLVKRRKFSINFYEMFPPDNDSGDHYYRLSDYYFLFRSMGYSLRHFHLNNGNTIYIADKDDF